MSVGRALGAEAGGDDPTAVVTPARQFEYAPYDVGDALKLERELGISHVLAQILLRRGVSDADAARAWLHPVVLHDPGELNAIHSAVELIERHISAGGRIVIHGDYDCDGVCATAVLYRALRSLGGDVGWYLPSRSEDGYGLAATTVKRLANNGTALLVTVDCGITAVDEVELAHSLGVDVVITDHHSARPDGALPDCPCVHPGIGGYPFGGLCGTAVAHKVARELRATTVEADLELVALATVADLMVLADENRTLVRTGLDAMATTERPGLRALMRVSRTDPSDLDARALGFRLAPRINAAGRMGRADGALELLLTEDAARANEIAEELDRINGARRAVEQNIAGEAIRQAREMGERPLYVLAGADWHAGVVGIVASRVVEELHRPAVLIALEGDDATAPASGSARSIPGFDLLAALDSASDCMVRHGGHRAAAGLTIEPERIGELRDRLERYAAPLMTPELLMAREPVDAVVSVRECSLQMAEEMLALEPCGMGNPSPRLLVPGAHISDLRPLSGGRHARFSVSLGGASANAIAFGCDGRVPGMDGEAVDASFSLERNYWHGVVEPRLQLRHAAPPVPGVVTTIGAFDFARYSELVRKYFQRPLSVELEAFDGGQSAGPATEREPSAGPAREPVPANARVEIDRCGQGALVTVRDVCAATGDDPTQVAVVCADVDRRYPGLVVVAGGFSLISHFEVSERPEAIAVFKQVVALDPPAGAGGLARLQAGEGFLHLAWGEPELRFAQQIHELEYALRASLVSLYRLLRERRRVSGEELARMLVGEDRWPRGAGLAARSLRVMTELGLAEFDPDSFTLQLGLTDNTELQRSIAYQAYTKIYEDGQRFLNRLTATAPIEG